MNEQTSWLLSEHDLMPDPGSSTQAREEALQHTLRVQQQQMQQQARHARAIGQIARALCSERRGDDLLHWLIEAIQMALAIEHCAVFQVSDTACQRWGSPLAEAEFLSVYQAQAAELSQGKVLTLSACPHCSHSRENNHHRDNHQGCALANLRIVPLRYCSTVLGAIVLGSRDYLWTPEDLTFVQTVADQVALALNQQAMRAQAQTAEAEQQQLTTALQKSEALNRVLTTIPDLIIRMTGSGLYLDMIPAKNFRTLMGHSEIGRNIYDILPFPVAEQRMQYVQQALETGELQLYEFELPFSDGSVQLEEARIAVSGPDEVVVIIRDITDRKRAEEALRQHQRELETLVENAPDIIARVDRQFRYIYVNRAAQRATGIPASVFFGKTNQELGLPEQQIHYWEQRMQQVLDTGRETTIEFDFPILTGLHYYQSRIVPEFADDGSIRSLLSITRDITPLKQAQAALQQLNCELEQRVQERTQALIQSEEQFRRVFDDAPIAISLARIQDYGIAQVNAAHRELFGYSDAELSHMTFADFTHPEDIGNNIEQVQQLLAGTLSRFQMEKRFFKRNGELIWTHLTVTLLRDRQGQPLHTLAMIEDISDRKQAEEQLKASLVEKEILLKEIHHRVKNNLQTISSLLRLQASSIQDPRTLALLKESQSRVQTMALIHEQIYQSPDLARINFASYVRRLVRDVFRSYNIHPQTIQLQVEVEPIELTANVTIPCGLIINELVSNALKYAFPDQRSGHLRIAFALNPTDPQQYMLTIQDDGIGLPDSINFRQTQSLGLQLVCLLTRQIQGVVELTRGGGSRFTITFPVQEPQPDRTGSAPSPPA